MQRVKIFVIILIFTAASGGWLWTRLTFGRDLGHDFTAFYIAGRIPLKCLYDVTQFTIFGQRLLAPQGIEYYPPYVRPAVFAPPLRLIMWMPYRIAFIVWLVLLYACYLCALTIGFRTFRPPFPAFAAFGFFYPALVGPTVGQDSAFLAAILAISLALMAARKDAASGAALALGLLKFNLILFVPLVFLLHGRRRALAAFCIWGGLLALASVLLSPPGDYIWLLKNVREYIGLAPTALSSMRGLLSDAGVEWFYYPSAVLVAVATIIAIKRLPIEQAFCLAVLASYLCAYISAWYDAVVLTAPLAAALARRTPLTMVPILFLLLFPRWAYLEPITAMVLILLFAVLVIPAFQNKPVMLSR